MTLTRTVAAALAAVAMLAGCNGATEPDPDAFVVEMLEDSDAAWAYGEAELLDMGNRMCVALEADGLDEVSTRTYTETSGNSVTTLERNFAHALLSNSYGNLCPDAPTTVED